MAFAIYMTLRQIIYNDIKNDNIVIVRGSSSFSSPVLIDFGKACSIIVSMARKKPFTARKK